MVQRLRVSAIRKRCEGSIGGRRTGYHSYSYKISFKVAVEAETFMMGCNERPGPEMISRGGFFHSHDAGSHWYILFVARGGRRISTESGIV